VSVGVHVRHHQTIGAVARGDLALLPEAAPAEVSQDADRVPPAVLAAGDRRPEVASHEVSVAVVVEVAGADVERSVAHLEHQRSVEAPVAPAPAQGDVVRGGVVGAGVGDQHVEVSVAVDVRHVGAVGLDPGRMVLGHPQPPIRATAQDGEAAAAEVRGDDIVTAILVEVADLQTEGLTGDVGRLTGLEGVGRAAPEGPDLAVRHRGRREVHVAVAVEVAADHVDEQRPGEMGGALLQAAAVVEADAELAPRRDPGQIGSPVTIGVSGPDRAVGVAHAAGGAGPRTELAGDEHAVAATVFEGRRRRLDLDERDVGLGVPGADVDAPVIEVGGGAVAQGIGDGSVRFDVRVSQAEVGVWRDDG